MTTMANILDEKELDYLMKMAIDPNSSRPDYIDITRLAKLMIPVDDVMESLKRQLHEKKEKEIKKKWRMVKSLVVKQKNITR